MVACWSLLVIALCIGMYFLSWLESVLLPGVVAVFVTLLLEPILGTLLVLPNVFCVAPCSLVSRCCPRRQAATTTSEAGLPLRRVGGDSVGLSTALAPTSETRSCQCSCRRILGGFWEVLSVLLCVVFVVGILAGLVAAVVASLANTDWNKYKDTSKLDSILKFLKSMGIRITSEDIQGLVGKIAPVLVADVVSTAELLVITSLLLIFCLVADVSLLKTPIPALEPYRNAIRRYLLFKTLISALIAVAVGFALWLLRVDLVVLLAVLTFFLNFIPNLGPFVATVLPLPLVFLDPSKNLQDLVMALVVPFALHNTIGCVLEPVLLGTGLELHPIVLIFALTFWGSVWGVLGAVLSVPLTSAIALALNELEHPYAKVIVAVMQGRKPAVASEAEELPSLPADLGSGGRYSDPLPWAEQSS
mmetsp:Transcript_30573/g.67122  ORF Transcript_30573/g.67122 Transcript_30573/m.67122 type:complete len:418 (+) Transcript_30573:1-1254(+)